MYVLNLGFKVKIKTFFMNHVFYTLAAKMYNDGTKCKIFLKKADVLLTNKTFATLKLLLVQ